MVLGDEVAAGHSDPCDGYAASSWADRLAAALRSTQPCLAYRNLGRRGLSVSEIRAGQVAKALAFKGDLAAAVVGVDHVLGQSFDADSTETELSRIIGPLRDARADVIVIGPFDISRSGLISETRRPEINQCLRQLAHRTHELAVQRGAMHVDLASHPASADPGIYSRDGRHFSARGHAVAAATVIRHLADRLSGRGTSV
ncbi:SGNH/GDSL hydrolase family protein [Streptomyces daliensis]|uniref:SGNH/GDSL hydrolase family protein n=1 Tax=Streptomyces daliensis TaxID=299421 RepID=A0A8T4IX23_9ACTN|nr:SGNH/GDSL hydrolase family protein [Streptomyces daliensis]